MNTRILIPVVLTIIAVAAGAIVLDQQRQLTRLHDQKSATQELAKRATEQDASESASRNTPVSRPSAELLELRAKVTQLMARKAELAGIRTENEQLQSQLANQATNSSALPPDYIRARDANWAGMSTPESTLQSFFWALRNRDTNALFQVLTEKSAERLALMLQRAPPEQFFKDASALPGMRLTDRVQLPDGSIEAKFEVFPGKPEPGSIHLRPVQGLWKMDLP